MAQHDDIRTYRDDPKIADLDFSMMSEADLANLALQRWDVLYDVPRFRVRVFGAWTKGNPDPLKNVVQDMGDEIAYRAAASVYAEYLAMRPTLKELAPKVIADIGCGYALFDLFAAQDLDTSLVLIDIEENQNTHFAFAQEASAYSNLAATSDFLQANGVAHDKVQTINPNHVPLDTVGTVDFACSWISCGFHYPLATYDTFFRDQVESRGSIAVDINPDQLESECHELARYGAVKELWRNNAVVRCMVTKP